MNNRVITVIAILGALFICGAAHAQQAKAYEMKKYTARLKWMVFTLNYADGYMGASTIKLREGGTSSIFEPGSGALDNDGSLRFTAHNNTKLFILLKNVDETTEAPPKLFAVYGSKGKIYQLLFSMVK